MRRARLALGRDADEAPLLLRQAATEAEIPVALELRRHALQCLVRRAESAEVLSGAILELVDTTPEDLPLLQEGLAIAEATRLHPLVDALLSRQFAQDEDPALQKEAVQRLVSHRLRALRDPKGALEVLRQAEAIHPEEGFGDGAYPGA